MKQTDTDRIAKYAQKIEELKQLIKKLDEKRIKAAKQIMILQEEQKKLRRKGRKLSVSLFWFM